MEGKEEIKQCLISGQKYFEIGKFPIKKTSLKNKNKNQRRLKTQKTNFKSHLVPYKKDNAYICCTLKWGIL